MAGGVHSMDPIVHAELSWLAAQKLDADCHHLLTRGVVSALGVATACAAFAKRRAAVFALALRTVHRHILCDLAGSGDRRLGGGGMARRISVPLM